MGAVGNACIFRHFYTQWDGVLAEQRKRIGNNQARLREGAGHETDFSSPYRVKVVKEFSKQRREEVDLETGRRKSWVEVQEFEVFDLTGGDSPAKKVDPRESHDPTQPPPPPAPTSPKTDPNLCPVCGRSFKGVKGVAAHRSRSRPTSACAVGKENREGASTPQKERTTDTDNNSVIMMQDTPQLRRKPLRCRN